MYFQSQKVTHKKTAGGKLQQKYARSARMNRLIYITTVEKKILQYKYLKKYTQKETRAGVWGET